MIRKPLGWGYLICIGVIKRPHKSSDYQSLINPLDKNYQCIFIGIFTHLICQKLKMQNVTYAKDISNQCLAADTITTPRVYNKI